MDSYIFEPIGYVESPYREKFGIPRQAGLVKSARGRVVILPPYARQEAFAGLESVSHIWLLFLFHAIGESEWRPTVRPPRLGGNKKVGVFATRSGFRPNAIGMSAVRLESVCTDAGGICLKVSELDLMDGTPVLDIKPYVPYADCRPDADNNMASAAPERSLAVRFSDHAEMVLAEDEGCAVFRSLIIDTLALDPRPAYKGRAEDDKTYGMRLGNYDIHWRIDGNGVVLVEDIIFVDTA